MSDEDDADVPLTKMVHEVDEDVTGVSKLASKTVIANNHLCTTLNKRLNLVGSQGTCPSPVMSLRYAFPYFAPFSDFLSFSGSFDSASEPVQTISCAPDGPGGCGGGLPVATLKSSRKRNQSRYSRREKMMKTNSWKSPGPFIGPKVSPRGSHAPDTVNTAIFLDVSSSLSA